MPSQLIYTSAPRLLEAGRTGFGTVARHRAVSGLLVAAVERVSQFARLSGLSPRRVVLSHRLIHAGASTYHVLSCIRDAGSDYTGRTNHLAHHVIANAREARLAAEAGITPADVLRQIPWRATWNESPRFFEPAEEISLTSFRPGITTPDRALAAAQTWQRLTGSASHALLPAQAQRCLLLLPSEDSALSLFQESLQIMGAAASWQVTFSTHIEPTDDLAELRWIALDRNSTQRQQVEGAARVTFDLTAPQSLPAPKNPELKASLNHPPVLVPAVSLSRSAPAQSVASSPLPPLFEERRAPGRRSPWPMVALAVIMAAAGVAAFVFLPKLPLVRPSQAVVAINIAKTVDDLWQKHHLILPTTKNWLKALASEALLDSHAQALNQIAAVLREPLRPLEIPRPESTQDEFMDMILHLSNWQLELHQALRDSAWSGEDAQAIQSQILITEGRLKSHWAKYAIAISAKPIMPDLLSQEIHQQVLKRLSSSVAPRQGMPEQWLQLLSRTRSTAKPLPNWIQHWEMATKKPENISDSDRAQLKEAAKLADAPGWFCELIQTKLTAPMEASVTTPPHEPATSLTSKPVAAFMAADGPTSSHPRYVIVESQSLPLAKALEAMPILPTEADMQIFVGKAGVAESQLVRWKQLGAGGVYRKSFNDSNTLEFRMHRLARLPLDATGVRIIARSADVAQVLFEIVLIPADAPIVDAWPISSEFTFQSRRDGSDSVLDAQASAWLQSIIIPGSMALHLQQVDDITRRFRLKNDGARVVVTADNAAAIHQEANKPKINALDVEIESLRLSLRVDEQRRTELGNGNLAQQQKESALERLDESLKSRQQRLSALENERRALAPEIAKSAGLPSGAYSLFAGLRRLCEIKIKGTNRALRSP